MSLAYFWKSCIIQIFREHDFKVCTIISILFFESENGDW